MDEPTKLQTSYLSSVSGLRSVIDLLRDFREFVPILLEIMDCLRELKPQDRQRLAIILAKRLCDNEDESVKFVQHFVNLGGDAAV